jgi:hypothetical protein
MSEKIKRYPQEILKLQKFTGFNELFEKYISEMTHVSAYENVELIHKQYFGFNKYSSFESFKRLRYAKLRNDGVIR